jgi:cyclopropane fatty-acyl-phospholipid synthase-like methyltransferase
MLRYTLAAAALKAFSVTPQTRKLYRSLGNTLGGKQRAEGRIDLPSYLHRSALLRDLYGKYETLQPTDRLLELGTGWMHWYAICLRLAYECRITTLDVWDNRQFEALKACVSRMPDRAPLLERALEARSFEELYSVLGFEHVIAPDGQLTQFGDESFSSIFSMHVLEHVPRKDIKAMIHDMYRIMKPGHHTIHQIGVDDHLAHYDRSESHKRYISFSHMAWGLFFDNVVQYHNRLQPSDFREMFEDAGFTLVHKQQESTDLNGLSISKDFQHYPKEDLACTILTVVFRK